MNLRRLTLIGLLVLFATLLFGGVAAQSAVPDSDSVAVREPDLPGGWHASELIEPQVLAAVLADTAAKRPLLLHVGFGVLYRSGHIPGSKYAGPGSNATGIASLQRSLKSVPKNRAIVLYCGCCPWSDCPNVRPAFEAARGLGFTNVRVLQVAKNFDHDWAEHGYPVTKGK